MEHIYNSCLNILCLIILVCASVSFDDFLPGYVSQFPASLYAQKFFIFLQTECAFISKILTRFSITVGLQYYIDFRCIAVDIYVTYKVITLIN